MTHFRPSSRLRLTLRTEEFDDTAALESRNPTVAGTNTPGTQDRPVAPPPSPQSPRANTRAGVDQRLEENQQRRQELFRRRSSLSPETFQAQVEDLRAQRARIQEEALRATRSTATASIPGLIPVESVTGNPPDDLTVLGDIEPISAQIERNGLATADTCTITLDYVAAPFDPRVIRAAHVEILVGVVPPEDYEAGVERGERRPDGSLLSTVGKQADGSLIGATRFVGFVDDWSVKYSIDGDTVVLECRDMSAGLRKLKANPGDSIDLALPIDQGIRQYLDNVSPTTRGTNVFYEGEGAAPTPAEAIPRRMRARRGRAARRGRRGGQDVTLWDHITDVCASIGLVPIMRGFDVVVIEPRTLYSSMGAIRMIYGRNLENLEFTRRLQGVKVPTIEVRAYDAERGRTLWARFPTRAGEQASGVFGEDNPPPPLRANEVTPSGANPTESIRTITVSGTVDPNLLQRIAENAFQQIGRQEIEGNLNTFDVSGFGTDPLDADLLQASAGAPVEILLVAGGDDRDELQPNTTLAQLQAMARDARRDYLVSLGWDERVAERFAALQEATGFQTVFRAQDLRIDWDHEEGIKIGLNFINYITVREDS